MKVIQFQFALFGINTYLVVDPDTLKCAIIDPGMMDSEEEEALDKYIKRNNLEVTKIINTHLHIDHVAGINFSKDTYNVPVLGNKEDEPLGQHVGEQAAMFGLPGQLEPVALNHYLNDGDVIKIGNGTLTVIHVPGHSPGSIALYDKADGFVITGDALFQGSIGRTDLPGGSMPQLVKSIKEKLLPLPDDTVVYPGHGPATTIGSERRYNPFL